MQLQPIELVGDQVLRTGQEACPHPKRLGTQPQVKACRLDLIMIERCFAIEFSGVKKRLDGLVGQNASCSCHFIHLCARQNQTRKIDASRRSDVLDIYPVVIWPVGLQPR